MNDLTEEVTRAIERGWALTTLWGKIATRTGWQNEPPVPLDQLIDHVEQGGNIGLRCGPVSGVVVIDVDTQAALEELAEIVGRDALITVTSKTADGWHLYYTCPGDVEIGNSHEKLGLPDDVHVRGKGGYVVLPGSMHPEARVRYEWCEGHGPDDIELAPFPAALLERAKEAEQPRQRTPASADTAIASPAASAAWARKALEDEVDAVANTPEGERNNRLNTAAFNLGQIVGNGGLERGVVEDALFQAALVTGLPESEIRQTLTRALNDGEKKPRAKPVRGQPPTMGTPARPAPNGRAEAAPPADDLDALTAELTGDDATSEDVLCAAPRIATLCLAEYHILRARLKGHYGNHLSVGVLDKLIGQHLPEADAQPSQADVLVGLASSEADLFHDPGGHDSEGFATIRVDRHRETYPINSRAIRRWLGGLFHRRHGKAPGSQAMQDALNVLAGKAIHEGEEHEVHVRLAEHEEAIYMDLANAEWEAVKVTAEGWQVVPSDQVPVRFIRKRGMLPLPRPEAGGSVDELRPFVNLPGAEHDDVWVLIVAFLVAAFRPRGPYPILDVSGEQGCGKSTSCRYIRRLVDPNKAPLRTPPKDDRDLMIAAENSWLVAFDNLSGIAPSLSDVLCTLATGGGFATRELYTDDGEKLFATQRPVMVNGIDDLATRPDLLDRAVRVNFPVIDDSDRQEEADLDSRFEEARPAIIGALLTAVSGAMRELPNVHLPSKPRMADFAKWVTAAEPALGWADGTFMNAYEGNRAEANVLAIESATIGGPLMKLMRANKVWKGSASQLLTDLEVHADYATRNRQGWPKSGKGMSNALRRLAPNLRREGIICTPPATGDKTRAYRLERTYD